MSNEMKWMKPEHALIVANCNYVVKTNGGEWRDPDIFIWPGVMVKNRMQPEIVRGRPIAIALVTEPDL